MGQASTIGLDIAKWVFQAHGADATGRVVFRKRLVRAKVLEFFAGQPPCLVALEACGGAHYWARELGKLGHTVRLIPPAYVKPFVKRQKNDVADAEAICEAAQRPGMRFVPVKDEAQQANTVVFRARDLLVRQRTQCINALRGHLAEYGHVVPQGPAHVDSLVALVEDPKSSVPESARGILQVLIRMLNALEEQLKELDGEIARRAKADPVARRLMTIPGIGPIAASAITALVPAPEGFRAGRDFAAWLGLTPLQKSTGGKHKLGAISKRGERTIRRLLILGASAVVCWASRRGATAGSWLARMLARKPRMLVTTALANKMARIVWALLVSGRGAGCPAPPPQIPACGFSAPGSCRRSDAIRVLGQFGLACPIRRLAASVTCRVRLWVRGMRRHVPSLRPAAFPPRSPPPTRRSALFEASSVLCSRPTVSGE